MPAPQTTRDDDIQLLKILDCADRHGPSVAMRRFGLSKGRYAGLRHRTVGDADKIPCKCRRKANRDGGMPANWWAS